MLELLLSGRICFYVNWKCFKCPVLSIGEASFIAARDLPGQTAVITTVAEAVPVIEGNIALRGHGGHVPVVKASGVPVLELEAAPEASAQRFAEVAETFGPEVRNIILGCAGAVALADHLPQLVPQFTLLDGVTAAARMV